MFCVKLHYIIVTSPSQMGGPTIEALLGIILRGFAFIKFQALLVEFLSHLMSLSYLKLFWWYPEFYHIWNPTIEALLWIIPWGICLYQTWSSFSAISITFDAFIILEAFLVVVWVLSHLKHHNWGAFGIILWGIASIKLLVLLVVVWFLSYLMPHNWSSFRDGSLWNFLSHLKLFW